MNTLSQQFNAQAFNPEAHWSLYIAPLFMLLILDDIARRETRRRRQLARIDHVFNARALQRSQARYHRQISDAHPPRRVAGPRL